MICTSHSLEQIMDEPRHGNPPQPWQQPPPQYQNYAPPPPGGQQYQQQPYPGQPHVVVVNAGGPSGPTYLSGMTTGENVIHGIITVCTFGLWAPIWWLRSRMQRRAIR